MDISENNETIVMYRVIFRASNGVNGWRCFSSCYDNNDVLKWPKIDI